jgi:hypothetical protein
VIEKERETEIEMKEKYEIHAERREVRCRQFDDSICISENLPPSLLRPI